MPAVVAVLTLAAGCAGGSSSTLPLGNSAQNDAAAPSHYLSATSAPAQSVKKIDDAVAGGGGSSSSPTPLWQFVEPLDVSDSGTFSVPSSVTQCAPMDPLFGVWYLALKSFTTPMSYVTLPTCTIATPAPAGRVLTSVRTAAVIQSPTPGPDSNLYLVELQVGLFSISLTPVAGPAYITPSNTWYFPALENNLSFQKDTIYSFYVSAYGGTGTPATISI
jgi:hypothetical protein